MKRAGKLLFMIIFLLAVLICPVINVYANNNIQTTLTEYPTFDNFGENDTFSDADFFDDEQINQISDFISETENIYQICIFHRYILISRYPTPIWQPPKNLWFNV